jgi:hypothetical protein
MGSVGPSILPDRLSLAVCGKTHAGCSKSPSSKAAASEEARRTLRYVEPLSDARTLLAGFVSILLKIPTAFDRLQQRHFVGILDIHPNRNAIGDTRDPGPERFQLVR